MKTKRLMLAAIAAIGLALPSAAETYILDKAQRYDTVAGHGYDLVDAPVYYSVKVPDGRYRVTFEIGSPKKAAETTVRAESRRLLVENLATRKGETVRKSFVVDKRSPYIDAETSVRLKPREKGKLDWDDRLTFEIGGENPAVRSITVEPADDVATVYLCGNSTVVDQEEEPWASWGQMVTRFFDDKVAVANYAESGESANTFIAARRLKRALRDARKGDWMFVEFGHNDQKQKGPGKGAWYSYLTSLKTFIDEARLKGVNIVLVTPTRRRVFDEYGRSVNTHEEFPDAMRWIAEKENVPLIELNGMTAKLYQALGTEGSKCAFVHYPMGSFPGQEKALEDNTHFNPYGAYQIAKCVIEGMRTASPALFEHIVDFTEYNPSEPDDPATFKWVPAPAVGLVKPDGN